MILPKAPFGVSSAGDSLPKRRRPLNACAATGTYALQRDPVPHLPEQHCPLILQGWPLGKPEAAWAGVGATMEVTNGKTMATAMPILRMATRRVGDTAAAGIAPPTSRCASSKWSRASSTTVSSTGAESCCESVLAICDELLLPLHSFNTAAAVEFRQCPTWRCGS
jgi:hypothetical protein